tara:strand:+ start:198 stop:548 length:351 start_codon:yes stop_codon:yes gene_type:complete
MAITYDWNCKTMDVMVQMDGLTDVVYKIYYKVTGISDTKDAQGNFYKSVMNGIQAVTYAPGSPFIPFVDLTNDETVAWTKAAMDADIPGSANGLEANIAYQIDLLINPVSKTKTIS